MIDPEILPEQRPTLAFFGIPVPYFAVILAAVVALGVYAGVLLFGPNSLTVLLGLEEQRTTYERHIARLKHENAALQKEYFELKQLEPDE